MSKPKKIYLVGLIETEIEISTPSNLAGAKISLIEKDSGICGMVAAFTNKKKAKKWAGNFPIIETEIVG